MDANTFHSTFQDATSRRWTARLEAEAVRLRQQFEWDPDDEAAEWLDVHDVRRCDWEKWSARIDAHHNGEVRLTIKHDRWEDPAWDGESWEPYGSVGEAMDAFAYTIIETTNSFMEPDPIPRDTIELRMEHRSGDTARNVRMRTSPGHRALEHVSEIAREHGLVVLTEEVAMCETVGQLVRVEIAADGTQYGEVEYDFRMFDHEHPLWNEWPR